MLMLCGHSANSHIQVDDTEIECCAICYPKEESVVPANEPDLTGRIAICTYCYKKCESRLTLPFFHYRPNGDTYYCGCRGWD